MWREFFDFVRCDWFSVEKRSGFWLEKKILQCKNEFYRFSDTWWDCDREGEESYFNNYFLQCVCNVSTFFSFETPKQNPQRGQLPRESMLHFDFYGSFTIYCVIYELFTRPSQSIMKIVLIWKPSMTIARCVCVTCGKLVYAWIIGFGWCAVTIELKK